MNVNLAFGFENDAGGNQITSVCRFATHDSVKYGANWKEVMPADAQAKASVLYIIHKDVPNSVWAYKKSDNWQEIAAEYNQYKYFSQSPGGWFDLQAPYSSATAPANWSEADHYALRARIWLDLNAYTVGKCAGNAPVYKTQPVRAETECPKNYTSGCEDGFRHFQMGGACYSQGTYGVEPCTTWACGAEQEVVETSPEDGCCTSPEDGQEGCASACGGVYVIDRRYQLQPKEWNLGKAGWKTVMPGDCSNAGGWQDSGGKRTSAPVQTKTMQCQNNNLCKAEQVVRAEAALDASLQGRVEECSVRKGDGSPVGNADCVDHARFDEVVRRGGGAWTLAGKEVPCTVNMNGTEARRYCRIASMLVEKLAGP